MSTELVGPETFKWFLTITTAIAMLYCVYDIVRLVRLRDKDKNDPKVRDARFGYWIGITILVAGVIGILRFHDVM